MYGAATRFGPGACRKAGRPWRPTGSRVLTTRAEDIASTKTAQQTVALRVTPYFHARKALLLFGSFLGSILAMGGWLELVGLQDSSKICWHSLSGHRCGIPWRTLQDGQPKPSFTQA